MLEDLNTLLSPTLIGIVAAVAVVCFVVGRSSTMGTRKREEALKRDVLDAKASVPQLESGIRNRDQQIARLQEEISDLNDRSNDLLRRQEAQNNDLRRAQREVKNLTSELNAVRGVRRSEDNLVMDGFEDEAAGDPGDSPLLTQLKKTEALYEKLKGALIKRDERIEELESLLQGERPAAADSVAHEDVSVAELKPLENRIGEQAGIIEALQEQVSELRKEKEMLEDLASRRSKSNRALKDATAEIEARVPALERQIGERDQTIVAREASIKRLLGEVETAKSNIGSLETTIETLTADLAAKTRLVETSEQRENALKSTIAAREERIGALDQELATTLGVVRSLEKDLGNANSRIAEQQSAAEKQSAELVRRQQAEATLTGTIRDRDFRIDTLTADKQALEKSLTAARDAARNAEQAVEAMRREAQDSQALFEKHQEAVASEKALAEREVKVLKREIDDLQSNLRQHQQWMEKLKASLEEKESRSREAQRKLETARAELDQANERLKAHHDERQSAEDAHHELEKEIVSLRSRDERIQAELAEHVQTLSVYKSMLADRDFRIEALQQAQGGKRPEAPVDTSVTVPDAPVTPPDVPVDTPVDAPAEVGVEATVADGSAGPVPVSASADGATMPIDAASVDETSVDGMSSDETKVDETSVDETSNAIVRALVTLAQEAMADEPPVVSNLPVPCPDETPESANPPQVQQAAS